MTVHTMVAELRRVCWLRHGGREGGHGARGEAVAIVRAAEHVEAAHTRMVHLKVGKKNDLLIARDGSCGSCVDMEAGGHFRGGSSLQIQST